MATWEEARAHLRSRYQLVMDVDPGDWIGMVWKFTYQDLLIEQRLKIERIASPPGDWLLVRTAVCKVERMDPVAALRFNARLAIGALVFGNDLCYLRATLPLKTLAYEDLDRTIEFLAREAVRLSNPRIVEAGDLGAPFTEYED